MLYDGFDLSPVLLITDIGRPLLPPQQITDKSIYGKSGVYFFGKQHEPITIPVDVKIHEDNNMTYRELTRFLAGKLNKDQPKRMIFEDEPNLFIEGIIRDSTEINNLIKAGEVTLNFFCPDPFYYEIDDEVFTFTTEGTHDFTREKGNTESLPTIEIKGTNSGGEIIIETDNSKVIFDGSLSNGETFVLDSSLITSYILETDGNKRSGNNDIDNMDFPYLFIGANNISVTVSGGSTIEEIKIHANSRSV